MSSIDVIQIVGIAFGSGLGASIGAEVAKETIQYVKHTMKAQREKRNGKVPA